VPPRVVALSSMGANRTSGVGMITALSLLEQGFFAACHLRSHLCAQAASSKTFSLAYRPPSPGQEPGPEGVKPILQV
jgi:hypothetical protein